VILATQEAKIRRIVVRSQPQANSPQDPILKTPITKKTKKME
jgi:mRNA-degrading endonuclease toxin of MazEF toxin-antitoxin module